MFGITSRATNRKAKGVKNVFDHNFSRGILFTKLWRQTAIFLSIMFACLARLVGLAWQEY
jgi:hypothetical protein